MGSEMCIRDRGVSVYNSLNMHSFAQNNRGLVNKCRVHLLFPFIVSESRHLLLKILAGKLHKVVTLFVQ